MRTVKKWQIRKLLAPCRIERRGRRWTITSWVSHADQVRLAIGRPPVQSIRRRVEVLGSGRTLRQATDAVLADMRARLL